jgi:hypothetical protein
MRFFDTILLPGIIMLVLDVIFLGLNRDMFQLQVAEVQRVVLEVRYLGAVLCLCDLNIRAVLFHHKGS